MKGLIPIAALSITLTACSPPADVMPYEAIAACERADVQDVVGKEVRNMMLKANADGIFMAAFMGFDAIKALEQARVSFSEVGVDKATSNAGPPFTQIVCGGTMQMDGSSALGGQDIVALPQLRWSINFAQPTQDPATAAFSVSVDPSSIFSGMLVNGKPAESYENGGTPPDAAKEAERNANDVASQAEGAQAEISEAQAAAEDAARAAAEAEQGASGKKPTDEDLYAPHSN